MAYTPQTWINLEPGGTRINATRLGHMEAGIEEADNRLTTVEASVAVKASLETSATAQGMHRNTDSPTYGKWFSFGNQANSAGFGGTGIPAEAYGPWVIYQKYGTPGGANAPVTKTTQGGYVITNYYGPTTDDSAEAFSTFVGIKDTGTSFNQAKAITGLEGIAQIEGANTANGGDSAPLLGIGARTNVLGTAAVATAIGFKASHNSSGGPPYGTVSKYIAFFQPVTSGATTSYGVYTADPINSETGFTLGKTVYSGSLSARLLGNTDGAASLLLINLPTATDVPGTLTGIRINAGTGQSKRLQEWWGPGAAGATSYVDNSGALNSRSNITVRDASFTPLFAMTTGGPQWLASSLTQLTVGNSGSASAPPATPERWLKVRMPDGSTVVIPAYRES